MSDFFKQAQMQAQVQDLFQKRFFESILHKQNTVGSFPAGFPLLSFYALPALMGRGMAVVVCADAHTVAQNMAALATAGYGFPQVAALDGTQMPHERREVQREVNLNHVQLLFTTPERFGTLDMLEVLVHATIRFVAIEEAQALLDGFSGTHLYWKLWDAVNQLHQLPTLVLMSTMLPAHRLGELTERLGAGNVAFFEKPPALHQSSLQVTLAITEREKTKALSRLLNLDGKLEEWQTAQAPCPTLIRVGGKKGSQRVTGLLHQMGLTHVHAYHPWLAERERAKVEQAFLTEKHSVVVAYGGSDRLLLQHPWPETRVVFWELPASLDELMAYAWQIPEGDDRRVSTTVMYTKEDYQAAMHRLTALGQASPTPSKTQFRHARLLSEVRSWVLSEGCRVKSLMGYWRGQAAEEATLACGVCDVCSPTPNGGFFRNFLKRWVY